MSNRGLGACHVDHERGSRAVSRQGSGRGTTCLAAFALYGRHRTGGRSHHCDGTRAPLLSQPTQAAAPEPVEGDCLASRAIGDHGAATHGTLGAAASRDATGGCAQCGRAAGRSAGAAGRTERGAPAPRPPAPPAPSSHPRRRAGRPELGIECGRARCETNQMPFNPPKIDAFRRFVVLDAPAILAALSALDGGEVDEILMKRSGDGGHEIGAEIGIEPVKVRGKRGKTQRIEEEIRRVRTENSAASALIDRLNERGAVGVLDGVLDDDALSGMQPGMVIQLRGGCDSAPCIPDRCCHGELHQERSGAGASRASEGAAESAAVYESAHGHRRPGWPDTP